ncbi:MAG: hypothetical protein IT458_18660 [Planctomycetes bacterium]|nr:hypothetical protein [Planctomycetota bacterium]
MRSWLLLSVLCVGTACSTTGVPAPAPTSADSPDPAPAPSDFAPRHAAGSAQGAPGRTEPGGGAWGERVQIDVAWLPAVWIQVDDDDSGTPAAEPETSSGMGYAVRAAVGNADQSAGILYMGSSHDEENAGGDLRTHAIYLDFDVSQPIRSGPSNFLVHAGGGVGVALADFSRTYDDVTSLAFNLRISLEYQANRNLSFDFGLGGFLWGHPGDTQAFGSFAQIAGRVSF